MDLTIEQFKTGGTKCQVLTCKSILNPNRIFCNYHWINIPYPIRFGMFSEFKDDNFTDGFKTSVQRALNTLR